MARTAVLTAISCVAAVLGVVPAPTMAGAGASSAAATPPTVAVVGNRLVDGSGTAVQLRGVNRSGSEYACAQGWGVFDGPVDAPAVAAMRSWGVNAVRIPLNEHCWLARNGVKPAYAGARYQDAVRDFVDRLHAAGMVAVLELHWSAAGSDRALGQAPMPNTDHSVEFWRQVATSYRAVPGVVFELFNEPHRVSWTCWRDGCTMPGGWQAAGMQELLDVVRSAGARQPVVATGLEWGNDLSGWLAHRPHDPAGALVAGFHAYQFNACVTETCWDRTVAPVAAQVPVVTTELGQTDCRSDFAVRLMRWADDRGVSYLPWTWNDWDDDCQGPALLTAFDGTPTAYGRGVRDHLRSRQKADPTPSPGAPSDGEVVRLGGATRAHTAAAVSAATFPTGAAVAFLARGDDHADALAAGPVAARLGGPVLLVDRADVPDATLTELRRLRPQHLVVLGGPRAVEQAVVDRVRPLATTVERIGGADRYDTAVLLTRPHTPPGAPLVYLASGVTFADALAGGAAAAAAGAPLLLVPPGGLPEPVVAELVRIGPRRVVVLGGPAALPAAVLDAVRAVVPLGSVERLAGADRYETAALVAATISRPGETVYVATGERFPDALAAVPAAGRSASPLVLVHPHVVPGPVRSLLDDLRPHRAVVLGGEHAVSGVVASSLLGGQ